MEVEVKVDEIAVVAWARPSVSLLQIVCSNFRLRLRNGGRVVLEPKFPDRFFHERRVEVGVDGVVGGGRRGQADFGTVFRALGHLQVLKSPFSKNL